MCFKNFIEINFEEKPKLASLFQKEVSECINLLELEFNETIIPGETLLFLDEIQATPEVFARLRFFYEQLPDLHIIAAGSLLEFLLKDCSFSMPVGRIEYMYLGPMNFREFLKASAEEKLLGYLLSWHYSDPLPDSVHRKLRNLFQKFIYLGGMPESIRNWCETKSFRESDIIKEAILKTYQDDFSKYKKRFDIQLLKKVYKQLPHFIGNKFKYSNVIPGERASKVRAGFDLLHLARITTPVFHSSSNGVPLDAEHSEKVFKPLFLDCGLMLRSQKVSLIDLDQDLLLVNNGAVAEQVVGQLLLYSCDFFEEPQLYYWTRESKSAEAEVDYVVSHGRTVIPVEVKAGKTGSLKSLHQFVKEKGSSFAIRFNDDLPSICDVQTKEVEFTILSLPLYMAGELPRLLKEYFKDKADCRTRLPQIQWTCWSLRLRQVIRRRGHPSGGNRPHPSRRNQLRRITLQNR